MAASGIGVGADGQPALGPQSFGPVAQQAQITASNAGSQDQFGFSAAIDGDTVVIGAPNEGSSATGVNGDGSDNGAPGSGAAYVFVRSGATWTQQAYLKASNTGVDDGFGCSVSISGDTVVIGARGESSNATGVNGNQADNSAPFSGAAYVFTRSGTVWSQQAYLKASNTSENQGFGNTVTMSGDTVVVAAPGEESSATGVNGNQADHGAPYSGAVYVFTRSNSVWTQQAYIKASNTGENDGFGAALGLAGDVLIVGASTEASNATGVNGNQADNSVDGAGAAYAFVRTGGIWAQTAYVKGNTTETEDYLGFSAAISGGTAIIGAIGRASGPAAQYAGTVFAFTGLEAGSPNAPEIAVEQPLGTGIDDGGGKNFGSVIIGSSASLAFTIKNTGTADLTGLGITIDGTNAAQFTLTALPSAPVAPAGSTTFTVQFTPSGFGSKTAVLHIANNDDNENPYDITLTGACISSPPTISDVTDQTVNEDSSTAALAFTLADADTPLASLTLAGSSSNTALVPGANIVFGGSGVNRTVTITPAPNAFGTATITLSVSDETNTVSDTFLLTVNAINDAPTITDIADLSIPTNGTTGLLSFSIGDVDSPPNTFAVSSTSNNQALVPNASIVMNSSGPSWTLSITPAANMSGTATITVTVTDTQLASSFDSFVLTVAPNVPPVMTDVISRAYVKASNTGGGDHFGGALDISGDTMVVGAADEDSSGGNQADNSASGAGAVYVFVRTNSTWTQQAYLKASNAEAGDGFGRAVAISGDTIVVGAPSEGSNATGVNGDPNNNSLLLSGAAYVFVRSGTTWTQQAYLKASNTDDDDHFGSSVDISGNTIVIGADHEDSSASGVNGDQANNGAADSGAAYVFTRSGTTWTQQAYLKASNTDPDDDFGVSVAVDGDTILVGAWREDSAARGVNGDQADNSAGISGATYVFTRSGVTWTQQAYLKSGNSDAFDLFGCAVSLSGDSAVIGARNESSDAIGVNAPLTGGAGTQADNSAATAGAAYVFTRSGVTWTQQAYLKPTNVRPFEHFGCSVAIDGNSVAVGANRWDSDRGEAFVFTRSGTMWRERHIAPGIQRTDDQFGGAVSISGGTVVFGALNESGGSTGIGGDPSDYTAFFSGAAYVFGLPGAPEIAIEQPALTNIPDGGTKDFGGVVTGSTSSLTFTILNTGNLDLTGLTISKDGPDAPLFTVIAGPVAPVGAFGSTTFTVQFAPLTGGGKTAALHIANNDEDENPFDIVLTGNGLVTEAQWRQQFFGTTSTSGVYADTADFDRDGIANLVEYAFALNPVQNSAGQLPQLQRAGTTLGFTFTQPPSVTGVTYGAQFTLSLTPANWQPVPDTGTPPLHVFSVDTGSSTHGFIRLTVTAP